MDNQLWRDRNLSAKSNIGALMLSDVVNFIYTTSVLSQTASCITKKRRNLLSYDFRPNFLGALQILTKVV